LEDANHGQLSAIVVLGGGTVCRSPEEQGRGSLASESLKRIVYSKLLHEIYGLPIIVSAGNVIRTAGCEPEAWVAKKTLLRLGVNRDQVLLEDESRNTWENALYIKKRYEPVGVLLVTSAYHMNRSIYCFEKNDIHCIPAPTDYKANRAGYSYRSFLPSILSLAGSYHALNEYVGMVYYKLRYR
jgi:uncharacterized SAM-binding protein YcdF (DUF218 family)